MPEHYEIKIRGHLDQYWSDWFAGLQLTHLEGGETLLFVTWSLVLAAALWVVVAAVAVANRGQLSRQPLPRMAT